ncbi:MAG: hypothetical protein ABIZ34_10310 [Candidatus Limnocylindrales bacterium]
MPERGPLELIWTTTEPDAVRARLARLGLTERTDGRSSAPPVVITVVGDPDSTADSLMVGEPLAAESDEAPTVAPRLAALGWATVDTERFAADLERELMGEPVRMPSLGADATRVASADGSAITLILLEPITEGRIAAALVRHAEGPIALYLDDVSAPDDAFASEPSPLGRTVRLIRPAPPSGPFILAVDP